MIGNLRHGCRSLAAQGCANSDRARVIGRLGAVFDAGLRAKGCGLKAKDDA
ncbi:hypothetical protein QWZ13_03940 [Reinekea marina]|uniref:hypothetical protein n=1 Tax=Reinekea marina TaxID=1310421 RepID=UPI0025B5DEB7|nr:hypothetical protein [Reinekea marina]MDN3648053.1 hypothetical protein [Reinekea marina]